MSRPTPLLLPVLACCAALSAPAFAANPPSALTPLRVSDNHRFLVTEDGQPFFWLGDTAWELFHRLSRAEAIQYLDTRAQQHFNVIQAVALAELDGVDTPNAEGDLPLIDRDPSRPAVTPGDDPNDPEAYDYWDHVDFIIDQANRRGLRIGLLPTWGAWVVGAHRTGSREKVVFNVDNARAYGEFLGRRYGHKGVIWILGGDRPADGFEDLWRAMARGITFGATGDENDNDGVLMTLHPRGGWSSSAWFHNDDWLDLNMQQTGHRPEPDGSDPGDKPTWQKITDDYNLNPAKPVLDGEPLYEDHPYGFRDAKLHGYSFDAHVRQRAYWHVFSGACGHTYGHHSVWQMFAPGRQGINGPLIYWYEGIHRPGGAEMQYLRALMESRSFLSRVPDQSLVVDPLSGADYIAATRGDGYAMVYSGSGRAFTVNLGKTSGNEVTAWWFNPRDGAAVKIGTFPNTGTREFKPHPIGGFGSDSVLVLDDASRGFPPPGSAR